MEEIKSCPFCGGKAKMLQSFGVMHYWRVECVNCYCGTGDEESDQEATEIWNRRVETREDEQ